MIVNNRNGRGTKYVVRHCFCSLVFDDGTAVDEHAGQCGGAGNGRCSLRACSVGRMRSCAGLGEEMRQRRRRDVSDVQPVGGWWERSTDVFIFKKNDILGVRCPVHPFLSTINENPAIIKQSKDKFRYLTKKKMSITDQREFGVLCDQTLG